ncbi:MAG: hypothetical protein WBV25_13780 [Methylocella sp.]
MKPRQELLQKWEARAGRFHPRMEITSDGLMLGAGTLLAKMAQDERGRPRLGIDDEPRAMALLATAYERPVDPYVLIKMQRACELWNADERALAHIHLAYANLPHCDEERALRLFAADELIGSGVAPATLMKAQGLDPAFIKFNSDQPRVPAGSGRESGRWTSNGDASSEGDIIPVSNGPGENEKERGNKERRERGKESPQEHLDHGNIILVSNGPTENEREPDYNERRERGEESPQEDIKHNQGIPVVPGRLATPPETAPPIRAEKIPAVKPFGPLESDLPRPGYGQEVSIPGLPDTVKGVDVTKNAATMPNYKTDLSRSEFESQLSQLGWAKEPSKDGKAMIYTKDGAKYSVRDNAKSTEGPAADFFHPSRNGEDIDMKLRLRNE